MALDIPPVSFAYFFYQIIKWNEIFLNFPFGELLKISCITCFSHLVLL